jgi:hypothetical protein
MEGKIEKALEVAKKKRQMVVDQINSMETQQNQLLQEALRYDGEVRALEALLGKQNNDETPNVEETV